MALDKQDLKLLRGTIEGVIRDSRQGKATAEGIAKIDSLGFKSQFPEMYRRFQVVQSNENISGTYAAYPDFRRFIQSEAQKRTAIAPGRQKDSAAFQLELVMTTLEMVSTAKVGIPDQVAVGLGYDFINALLDTDFKNLPGGGLRSPFPGPFSIRLPRGFSLQHQWQHQGGSFPLQLITLAPFEWLTERWGNTLGFLTVFRSGVPHPINDMLGIANNVTLASWLAFSSSERPTVTIGELRETSFFAYQKSTYTFTNPNTGESRTGLLSELVDLVYGLLLYLNLPKPSLARASNGKPVSLVELVEAPQTPRKIKATSKPANWPTVVVDEEVPNKPRTAYRHFVRGIWFNQAYGPKYSLVRLNWRKPHERYKNAPGPARKDYEIEGLGAEPGDGCEEIKKELWAIRDTIQHVKNTIASNQSDRPFVRELEQRLDELEREYAELYEVYEQRCDT